MSLIDTNVTLSRWPFRRLRGDDTAELVQMLRDHGVTQAWAGTFDGLLHKDLAAANERLAEECRQHGNGLLLPFGSINPTLPDWEDDVHRCVEQHKMRGIRLHPNYHGYKLDHPHFARLLALAAERRLLVQLAVSIEDQRTQHPLMQVPDVDTAPLPDFLKPHPHLRLLILNGFRSIKGETLRRVAKVENIYFEIATLEGAGGISTLMESVPVHRILFGSHAPFFYFESALLKLKESSLNAEQLQSIRHHNAQLLMA